MTLMRLATRAEKLVIDNSPLVLTAIGVIGTVTTALLTGQAVYKYMDILAEEGYYSRDEVFERSTKEHIENSWKLFVPAIGTGALTIGAILSANHIGTRRAAGMAAAYSLSERAFSEYKEKVIQHMGSKSEQSVRDDIASDHVRKTSEASREVIVIGTEVLCFESMTGRYFTSNMEALKKAQNDINYQMLHDGYASVTDFYNLIGLTRTAYSDELGWTSELQLELIFTTALTDDQRPCLAFEFRSAPIRNYHKIW
jgi:hypothetical protein